MGTSTGPTIPTPQSPLLFHSDPPAQSYRPLDHIQMLRQGGNDPGMFSSSTMSRPRRNMHQSFMTLCAEVGTSVAQEQEEVNLGNVDFEGWDDKSGAQTRLQQETRRHLDPILPSPAHKARNRFSSSRQEMMRSLPALSRQTLSKQKRKQLSLDDTMTSSQILQRPSVVCEESTIPETPVSQVSNVSSPPPITSENIEDTGKEGIPDTEDVSQSLPDVLMTVFDLENREEVEKVYPCWTIRSSQSAMIPGHMYIMQSVVCFYAYLPKRAHAVFNSGYLLKRGRQNPRFNRYWFVLKGNSLSYYTDKSQPYFPRNTIDLSSATSVQLLSTTQQPQTFAFSISTNQETFHFKSETAEEAKQWIQQIENAIVRCRNDSDSIKYLIPIKNIIGIEEEQILEGTTTIQINVKNTGAGLDEYIFSFFTDASEAKDHIVSLQAQTKLASSSPKNALSPILEPLKDIQIRAISGREDDTMPSLSGAGLEIIPPPPTDRRYSTESLRPDLRHSSSTSSIVQKATGLAGYVKTPIQRVTNLLAAESYNYYGKAYGMWAGNKIHYIEDDTHSPALHESQQDDKTVVEHNERFRNHFALPKSERLQATFYCYLSRTLPRYGKIYMGITRLCFRSLIPPFRIKMILPYKAIESITPKQSHLSSTYGLVLSIRGQEELFFEFREQDSRDDCASMLYKMMEAVRYLEQSSLISPAERAKVEAAKAEHELLKKVRRGSHDVGQIEIPDLEEVFDETPVIYDEYGESSSTTPVESPGPLRITCLTIGSRGDVQPFIALCKGLQAEGHTVTIATHLEFEDWIRSHGINFAPIAGDPAQLMRLCVEHDMFTPGFVREAWFGFRNMVNDILVSAWQACLDTPCDLLIEAPNAMAGPHIAEALHIPLFRAFTMPWTKTRAHPHAFLVPRTKRGGLYNLGSHVLFQQAYWQGISGLVNTWRKEKLGLPPTGLAGMQQERIPFMYNFSPEVVSTPLDWEPWVRITGYWFLDEGSSSSFTPALALVKFIAKAREDGKRLVYIGFGSIVIDDAASFTEKIVQAVVRADVRCILSKGWSGRLDTAVSTTAKSASEALPNSIYAIDKAPHDWLFAQMDAAVHHGGAGTTGASIRAGIPTIIKPFFGDQWFFGQRVEDLGIGMCLHKIEVDELANALRHITTSVRMCERAKELGEKVRGEDGVKVAIATIYRHLEYARSLVRERDNNAKGKNAIRETSEGLEEGWTLVGEKEEEELLLEQLARKGSSDVEGLPAFTATLGKMDESAIGKESETSVLEDEDDVELMD